MCTFSPKSRAPIHRSLPPNKPREQAPFLALMILSSLSVSTSVATTNPVATEWSPLGLMKECTVDDPLEHVTRQINDDNIEQLPHTTEIVIQTKILMTMTVTMSAAIMAISNRDNDDKHVKAQTKNEENIGRRKWHWPTALMISYNTSTPNNSDNIHDENYGDTDHGPWINYEDVGRLGLLILLSVWLPRFSYFGPFFSSSSSIHAGRNCSHNLCACWWTRFVTTTFVQMSCYKHASISSTHTHTLA